jgi:hypothetical protein
MSESRVALRKEHCHLGTHHHDIAKDDGIVNGLVSCLRILKSKHGEAGNTLDTIFTNKLNSRSTPYMMFKKKVPRPNHIVIRLAKMYNWFVELTGEGLSKTFRRSVDSTLANDSEVLDKSYFVR